MISEKIMEINRFVKILSVLMFVLSLCMKLTSVSSAEVRCIDRERQALLKFKHDLVDKYGTLSSWGSEEVKKECCKWKGISCSNETGHVVLLSLTIDGIYLQAAKLSPALLELQHLNYLDLSNSDFGRSEIPRFIGSFKKLRHLGLSGSNFIGEVPCELGNLTNLHTLDLRHNNLRIKNLEWLSHLSLLSHLDLSDVNLMNQTSWLHHITRFPFLEKLYLSNCQIPNTVPSFDSFTNSSLPNLSILDLSSNDLTSSSFAFHWLFNFSSSLTSIDLSNNLLEGPIPDAFGELIFLEKLVLTVNKLRGRIPKSLGNLSHLYSLDISYNELSGPLSDFTASLTSIDLTGNRLEGPIPDAFGELIFLEELVLDDNKFRGRIPKSLGNLSHLNSLDVSFNELNGPLPDFTKLSSLRYLSLRDNKLNGFDPQSPGLPSSLESLQLSDNQFRRLPEGIEKLHNLDMSSNLLEGTITEWNLSNFANLQSLYLYNNSLAFNLSSDWIPHFQLDIITLGHCNLGPHFPNWIRTQSTLQELDLSLNGISDSLPNWLWNMSSLKFLDLSHNNISGRISNLSSKLIHRDVLDLSYNNFSGPIPLFFFQYEELRISKNMFSGSIFHLCTISEAFITKFLDLSYNQLEGELPNCWMNMRNLSILDLANNKFSGKIPLTLGNLDQLEVLHLRNNNFIGELPSTLRNCTWLGMLDVGGNKLTGNIPAWIGTHLTSLTILSLRGNEFDGIMPSIICRLTSILVLDLSRNNISGRISHCLNNITAFVQKNGFERNKYWFKAENSPYFVDYDDSYFVQWKGQDSEYKRLGLLKGIDLSGNKLFGPIPQEFSTLSGLIFLNLSRNHLTGNIISNIGQMEMLECLDLSRNQLSGKIPNSLAHLNFLSVLDLAYNNLTGKIPLGTQLQSFNSSVYAGNSQLCGKPLTECPEDISNSSVTDHGKGNIFEEDDEFITRDFYICMAFGFITGFWVVVITLFLKHSWRHSYFNFWNNVGNWMYVTTTIYATRFKRKIQT